MPTYQCPRCDDTFSVLDSEAVECPSCRKQAEEGLFCRIGKETVGPVSYETIREIVQDGILVRRGQKEWTTAGSLPEFSRETETELDNVVPTSAAEEAAPLARGRWSSVFTLLCLFAIAASGWVFHFATRPQDAAHRQSDERVAVRPSTKIKTPEAANSVRNGSKATSAHPVAVARRPKVDRVSPIPKARQQQPRIPAKIQFTIKPLDKSFQRVAILVVSSDNTLWKRLQATTTPQQLAAAVSLRLSNRRKNVKPKNGKRQPTLPGKFTWDGATLRFEPTAPLQPGKDYVATFAPTQFGDNTGLPTHEIRRDFQAGKSKPRVLALHPRSFRLPANLSRFHVQFSEPMQQENAARFFELTEMRTRQPVGKPFPEKLVWSPDGRQCTVYLRDGDLQRRETLVSGTQYRLAISGKWPSMKGIPLGGDYSRTFRAHAIDAKPPQPARWAVRFPRREGSTQPVQCRMPQALDWELLHSEIAISDPQGRPVTGDFTVIAQARHWMFRPHKPWLPGRYTLAVGSHLADLAGNKIVGNLELPPGKDGENPKRQSVLIRFELR